jgi:hypothetical protein
MALLHERPEQGYLLVTAAANRLYLAAEDRSSAPVTINLADMRAARVEGRSSTRALRHRI